MRGGGEGVVLPKSPDLGYMMGAPQRMGCVFLLYMVEPCDRVAPGGGGFLSRVGFFLI